MSSVMSISFLSFLACSSLFVFTVSANIELGERNAQLAGLVSGSYQKLDIGSKIEKKSSLKCPQVLELILKHDHGQKFMLDTPQGLVDPSGECGPVPGFRPSKTTVMNYGETLGLLSQLLSHDSYTKTNMMGTLPAGALKCKGIASYHTILISSLRGDIAAAFRARLESVGIAPEILADVFEPPKTNIKWHSSISASVHQKVQTALDKLDNSFSLILPGSMQDPVSMTMVAVTARTSASWNFHDSCAYLGGQLSFLDILQHITEITKAVRPLFRAHVYTPIVVPKGMRSYYAASRSCPAAGKNELKTVRIADDVSSGAAFEHETHVTVWVNEFRCSEAVITNLLESESELPAQSRTTALKILNHLHDAGELSDIQNSEGVLAFFLGLARELNEAEMKSEIFVAEADIQHCPGFSNSKPLSLIFVEKASNTFYCNAGTTTVSCLDSKSSRSTYGATVRQEIAGAASLFVTSDLSKKACIFSTSIDDEASVGDVPTATESPPGQFQVAPGAKLESTSEYTPEPSVATTPAETTESTSTFEPQFPPKYSQVFTGIGTPEPPTMQATLNEALDSTG